MAESPHLNGPFVGLQPRVVTGPPVTLARPGPHVPDTHQRGLARVAPRQGCGDPRALLCIASRDDHEEPRLQSPAVPRVPLGVVFVVQARFVREGDALLEEGVLHFPVVLNDVGHGEFRVGQGAADDKAIVRRIVQYLARFTQGCQHGRVVVHDEVRI